MDKSRLITEKELRATVIELAELNGWMVYAVFEQRSYAKRTSKGWPDLVLLHPGEKWLTFVELKSEKGKITPEQEKWLEALVEVIEAASTSNIQVVVWRPSNLDDIQAYLEGK